MIDLSAGKLITPYYSHVKVLFSEHKSRAFYRIQATRNMTGGGDVIKKGIEKVADAKSHAGELSTGLSNVMSDGDLDPTITRIQFKPKDYRVSGEMLIIVTRNRCVYYVDST